MEGVLSDGQCFHLGVRYFQTFGIFIRVHGGFDCQSLPCFRRSYQVDDRFDTDERLTSSILADMREHPMFNLVPFTGSWREMTD